MSNSTGGCGGVFADYGANTVTNCIVRDNSFGGVDTVGSQLSAFVATMSVSYSNIAGGQAKVLLAYGAVLNWQTGNLDTDPLFVDADGADNNPATFGDNDYHLTGDSTCIDAGDSNYVPQVGETDIDGEDRVQDGQIETGCDEVAGEPMGMMSPMAGSPAGGDSPGSWHSKTLEERLEILGLLEQWQAYQAAHPRQ